MRKENTVWTVHAGHRGGALPAASARPSARANAGSALPPRLTRGPRLEPSGLQEAGGGVRPGVMLHVPSLKTWALVWVKIWFGFGIDKPT